VKILIIGPGTLGYLPPDPSAETIVLYGQLPVHLPKSGSLMTNKILPVMETGEDFSAATKLLETKWIDIVVVFTGDVSVVPILLPAIGRHRQATTTEERTCEISQARFYLLLRRPGARLFEEANQRSSTSRDAREHQHQHLRL
jgi:hypothetical protein